MTDRQKREMAALRRLRKSHKEIATIMGVGVRQVEYWLKKSGIPSFHAAPREARHGTMPDPYRVRATLYPAQHKAACDALRAEIKAARAERATAPIFRIRPDEWATA